MVSKFAFRKNRIWYIYSISYSYFMWFLDQVSGIISQFSEKAQHDQESFLETLKGFNDSMVQKVSWLPLKWGWTNFQTHNLVQNEQGNLEYKASFMAMLFSMIFIWVGVITWGVFLTSMIVSDSSVEFDVAILVPAIFTLIFPVVGIFMLMTFRRKRIFDFQTGYFSVGKIPENNYDGSIAKNMTSLRDIRAIQVIGENCSGSKGSRYRSYEINLVLRDASRVNVIDHGNISQILLDAQQIAGRLRIPVWDVSSYWNTSTNIPFINPIEIEDDKNIKSL